MGPDLQACPHCGAALPYVRDAFCPECAEPLDDPSVEGAPPSRPGFAYSSLEGAPLSRPGFAYSPLARVALLVGVLFSLIGCVAVGVWAMVSVAQGNWVTGLLVCPICFFHELAFAVVFMRVMDLKEKRVSRTVSKDAEQSATADRLRE